MVELSKAYYSVKRNKLFEILYKRAKTPLEGQFVRVLANMYQRQKLSVGDQTIDVTNGVTQGSEIAPLQFSIYVKAAIDSNPLLTRLAQEGRLLAYADDIIIVSRDKKEHIAAIKSLENLNSDWN